MRFDDRLKTVLDAPVNDDRDRAVRWRQLVDLLSRARGDGDPSLIGRAIEAARNDRSSVPDNVRAATARSIAGRPIDSRLIALFASDRLEVAAPILAGATLDAATRADVAAGASDDVRRFFFALQGTPPPPEALDLTEVHALTPEPVEESDAIPSIVEAVARIEALRLTREASPPLENDRGSEAEDQSVAMPPIGNPTHAQIALFRWESDALGSIAWVEGAPRGALIGRALTGYPGEALLAADSRELVARRAHFADVPLASAEPFGGLWQVSGAPAFAPGDGRFIGYRGIARRTDLSPTEREAAPRAFEGADSLREMIHEIKTPLNAIIGFAEIIDGQYLGPAHRGYRQRAADILARSRDLLTAIDDLDFAASVQSRGRALGEGTDLKTVLSHLAAALNDYGAPRGIGIDYRLEGRIARCALAPELFERLIRRFVEALVDASEDGQSLSIQVTPVGRLCALRIARPSALRDIAVQQLFDPAFAGPADRARIGLGFALRLVRGLARLSGGEMEVHADCFVLRLPVRR